MNTKTTIEGRLGRNPEPRFTKTGKAVCSLRVAVNKKIARGGGYENVVTWHTVVLWETLAEDAQQILKKGMLVRFAGILKHSEWIDRGGQAKTATELVADKFEALDSPPSPAPCKVSKPANGGVPRAQIPDCEIPF